MLVSLSWLKELVDYQLSADELANVLSLSSIGVKQQTEDYLELDLTYNRGDLLSLRGIAYEVAAITNTPLKFLASAPEDFIWVGKNLPQTPVGIEDERFATVQCVAKIENLKVAPSSPDWAKKLADSGMRPVNNIADVTNLIMLEFGQPLHSFDAAKVEDETIIVRTAKKEEALVTLDGKLRKLTGDDLVLADTKGPLDVAGIMGGKDSEVTASTTSILLSASIFNPIMVRRTSKRLGLYSEACKRFQHGLSKMRLLQALDEAIKMYQKLGGRLTAITLKGDFSQVNNRLNLSIKKTNDLLGIKLDEGTIEKCLKRLNFSVSKKAADTLEVTPPYFRQDCNIEEDLIEEIARIYGYSRIENKPLEGETPKGLDQSLPEFIYKLRNACKEVGLTEVSSYSFYSSDVLDNVGYRNEKLMKIANPISSETEFLRSHLWPNLLETAAKNLKKGYKDVAIFELGKVYYPKEGGLPDENYALSILLVNQTDNPTEELSAILQKLDLDVSLGEKIGEGKDRFHPTRYVYITKNGQPVGKIGEVHPKVLNKFGVEQRVAVVEIALEK